MRAAKSTRLRTPPLLYRFRLRPQTLHPRSRNTDVAPSSPDGSPPRPTTVSSCLSRLLVARSPQLLACPTRLLLRAQTRTHKPLVNTSQSLERRSRQKTLAASDERHFHTYNVNQCCLLHCICAPTLFYVSRLAHDSPYRPRARTHPASLAQLSSSLSRHRRQDYSRSAPTSPTWLASPALADRRAHR
jgi:hypothetical protein